MKLTSTAKRLAVGGLAMGGLAMGAGLVLARLLARGRNEAAEQPEPPSPQQLIGQPRARLSAVEAAETFTADPEHPH